MPLLLDTHVWLWSLLDPDRVSRQARTLLGSSDATLHVSPISLWETLLLAERGSLTLRPNASSWLQEALVLSPVTETPLNVDVALASRSIDLPHQDPADRFIAATANVYGLTLVTADARLLTCPDIDVTPA